MENISTTTLTMVREFNVAPEKVFDAWINPNMMKKWFFTLEGTNKVCKNNPEVGGTWEIVDHRGGKDYRAIGEYLEIDPPKKLVFTFKMPELSGNDLADTITVELKEQEQGCEMTFTQEITVIHEENWTDADIVKAHDDWRSGTEQGWYYMFLGLKELVETGKISYTGQ
ncbi:SRPBCC family protein [Lysinibacillus endophyticus]|uniref:SRPBCC domain-containing protein n=1 Tax=Ureibacillus endophyticus TaxID=1978490 RepID=A0A494Z345_9BACL|nr:SRPBCC domain-containing protein [Lysinibacillus endophyticus]MCP1144885.1 SRPBCC domain-containing protein [Lysinibacillus endophyticus]RKQ16929.1 SRPBCC domain-containing protein [Lysinibacillus endophyticus]